MEDILDQICIYIKCSIELSNLIIYIGVVVGRVVESFITIHQVNINTETLNLEPFSFR